MLTKEDINILLSSIQKNNSKKIIYDKKIDNLDTWIGKDILSDEDIEKYFKLII